MKKFGFWIEAMRLRTLPVSVAGVVAAAGVTASTGSVDWLPLLLCLAFAILCQIASNFANEYFDFTAGRDRPGREGPRRGVTEGDITPAGMRKAIAITLGLAACTGLSLVAWGGWWLLAIGALVGLGLFAYSTGPYPLSTHGWGEVAVVLFFGLIPVCLTCWLQTHTWTMAAAATGCAVGLLGANVLIVNNYRDVEDDRAVNKLTLAVRLGARRMPALYLCDNIAASLLMLVPLSALPLGTLGICGMAALPAVAGLAIVRAMLRREGHRLTPLLGASAVFMFVYSLFFAIAAFATMP